MDEQEGLVRLASFHGPAVIDFDETLYLRNSTEQYLDAARPKVLAAFILRLLQALKPWRLTGGSTQDVWRVACLTLFFPWALFAWRRRCPRLAAEFTNEPLAAALRGRAETYVATLGFAPVIRPLLHAMGFSGLPLAASRMHRFEDRRRGKAFIVERAFGKDLIRDALVFTDSEDDRPLLDACRSPFLLRWRAARYERAGIGLFFPFDYLTQMKRPGKGALKSVIVEDLTTWMLATAPFLLDGWQPLATLLLLFLSFWSVYEIGYIENDIIAVRHELDGTVTPQFDLHTARSFRTTLWVYAAVFGLGAAFVTPFHSNALGVVRTGAVLALVHVVYLLYNRVDKLTRVWLYAILQGLRAFAFAALIPMAAIGVALTASLAIARWMLYILYRLGPKPAGYAWPVLPTRLIRLAMFLILALALGAAHVVAIGDAPSVVASLAWLALLSRNDIRAAIAVRSIRRPGATWL